MLYCENANDHGILIRTGQANSVMRPLVHVFGDQADRQQGRLLAGGCGAPGELENMVRLLRVAMPRRPHHGCGYFARGLFGSLCAITMA